MEKESITKLNDKFTLVNHASVLIESGPSSILSDPWYFGSAFNNGWQLLFENNEDDIKDILKRTKYIWISHEHPDHFSVPFFLKYKEFLLERNIQILFQETKDGRVRDFLNKQGFSVIELQNEKKYDLDENIQIRCIKSGFYDSALFIETKNNKILNLNDCPLREKKDLEKISKKLGDIDVLLSQFSYAAWKGGKANINWRKAAAEEKIRILKAQKEAFNAKLVVPFASFVKFCSKYNKYLNDNHNTPPQVIDSLKIDEINIAFPAVMKTYDIDELSNNKDGLDFWAKKFNTPINEVEDKLMSINILDLTANAKVYQKRVLKNNNSFLMWLIKNLGFLNVFQPVTIKLYDLDKTVKFEFFSDLQEIYQTENYDIEMHSNSLNFIFKNPFGFDTLTVNGCFEEKNKGAFLKMTKNFAIENLNNLGVSFGISAIFNYRFFPFFYRMMGRVKANL